MNLKTLVAIAAFTAISTAAMADMGALAGAAPAAAAIGTGTLAATLTDAASTAGGLPRPFDSITRSALPNLAESIANDARNLGSSASKGTALSLALPTVSTTPAQRTGCGVGVGSFDSSTMAVGAGCAYLWTLKGGQGLTGRVGAATAGSGYTGVSASASLTW